MGLEDRLIDSIGMNINRNEIYISGGYSSNGLLKSSEVHTFDTEAKVGPDLPCICHKRSLYGPIQVGFI